MQSSMPASPQGIPGPVVITGASGGLGTSLVKSLLASGFRDVVCQYRSNATGLVSLFSEFGLDSAKHLFQADLSNEAETRALRDAVIKQFGSVWGLVNLAGGSSNGMSWKLSLEEFQRIVATNLTATFLTTREFLPVMRESGHGRVINTSSIVAHSGIAGASHYCAAKAGIEGFTKAIAHELASKKITANCIALGYFDEGLIRDVPPDLLETIKGRILVKRLGSASELFPLVSYLLDVRSAFMTGQVIHLNGGQYT